MLNESYIEDKGILRINPHALGGAGGESRKIEREQELLRTAFLEGSG
jgi:hypothetical protein